MTLFTIVYQLREDCKAVGTENSAQLGPGKQKKKWTKRGFSSDPKIKLVMEGEQEWYRMEEFPALWSELDFDVHHTRKRVEQTLEVLCSLEQMEREAELANQGQKWPGIPCPLVKKGIVTALKNESTTSNPDGRWKGRVNLAPLPRCTHTPMHADTALTKMHHSLAFCEATMTTWSIVCQKTIKIQTLGFPKETFQCVCKPWSL